MITCYADSSRFSVLFTDDADDLSSMPAGMLLVGPDRVDVVTGVHSGPVSVCVEIRDVQPADEELDGVDVDEVQLHSRSEQVWVRGPMDMPPADPIPGLVGDIGMTVIGYRDDSSYDMAVTDPTEKYTVLLWPFAGEQLRHQARSRAAQDWA